MELQRNPLIFANEDLKDSMRILKTYISLVNITVTDLPKISGITLYLLRYNIVIKPI